MSNTDRVISAIEQSNLVSAEVVAELRRRIEKTPAEVDLKSAIKWLVGKGHITPAQGKRLVANAPAAPPASRPVTSAAETESEIKSGRSPRAPAPMPAEPDELDAIDDDLQLLPNDEPPPKPTAAPAAPARSFDDDELELLPEEPTKKTGRAAPAPAARRDDPVEDDLELFADEPPTKTPGRATSQPAARAGAPIEDDLELFPDDAGEPPSVTRAMPAARAKSPSGAPRVEIESPAAPWTGAVPASQPAAPAETGGIDDLFGEALGGGGGPTEPAGAVGGLGAAPARARVKLERNVWDSPLLLIGGGSLLLMLIVGFALYWRLSRQSGDQVLAAAETDYKAGSYSQAIHKYDAYLAGYSTHTGVSLARVHRAMAQMRQAVDGTRDWTKALRIARKTLSEISSETEFGEARPELAALLPTIAEGLSKQAAEQSDATLIEQSREAMALVDKYVPKTLRPGPRLSDIDASLALTSRRLQRGESLKETIATMQKAIEGGATQEAYAARKQLLKKYPDLATDESLQASVLQVSQDERARVQYTEQARPPAAAEASILAGSVALASRSEGAATGVDGDVVYALAGGAAYALDAANGQLLWRRFVGFDTEFVPTPLSPDTASDALVVDSVRHEVLRVASRTGEVRWRQAIGEPFEAHPVWFRNQIMVATTSGLLVGVDLESGSSPGATRFAQPLRLGPAADSRQTNLYLLGEHSNLYVLSPDGRQCREVLYLGHEAESVRVPPVAVSRYVFIAENSGANDSVLRVLTTDENGLAVKQTQQIPLAGHVYAPLQASDRSLLVATDRGALYSFEISAPGQGDPLSKVAEKPPVDEPPLVRFPLYHDSQLWLAGLELTKYDIQSARGRLEPRWIKDAGDTFQQRPRLLAGVLFHARQKGNLTGVVVSAVSAADGQRLWETHLAAPAVCAPIVEKERITVIGSGAAVYEVPLDLLKAQSVYDKPASQMRVEEPLPQAMPCVLPGGRIAVSAGPGPNRLLLIEPHASRRLHWLEAPAPLAASPLAFDSGILTATLSGQVLVLDAESGKMKVEPFAPLAEAGVTYPWSRAASLGPATALISDGRSKLYLLAVAQQPAPAHLVAQAEANLPVAVTAPIAALDEVAYVADVEGQMRAFRLSNLEPGAVQALGGSCVWGPQRVGDRALVATSSELFCFNAEQQIAWRISLANGGMAGDPLLAKDGLIVALTSGVVFRLAPDTGEELARFEVGQPLATGPVSHNGQLLFMAHDGCLLVTELK